MNTNNGWLDIAGAPKDGTEILAWRHDCGQFIASYTSADAFPMTQDELDAYDEATLFAKDWFTQWPDAPRLDGSEAPTLWQPMPADPCLTCGGHGLIGGLTQHSGSDAEPCPDCTPPAITQDAITVSLDPDPRGVSVGVWQGPRCIYTGAHPLPASAQDDAKDEKQAFEAWHKREFGSYVPEVTNHYNRWLGWEGRASVAAPAAGDARMAQELLPKLQSLLDRMANDPHTGTMFEADGDTLRDAMYMCRSVVVNAASQQQEG